jgi:hypothetical protein
MPNRVRMPVERCNAPAGVIGQPHRPISVPIRALPLPGQAEAGGHGSG